jgi:hypothetical protein
MMIKALHVIGSTKLNERFFVANPLRDYKPSSGEGRGTRGEGRSGLAEFRSLLDGTVRFCLNGRL